jgi:hypothetical protein
LLLAPLRFSLSRRGNNEWSSYRRLRCATARPLVMAGGPTGQTFLLRSSCRHRQLLRAAIQYFLFVRENKSF